MKEVLIDIIKQYLQIMFYLSITIALSSLLIELHKTS